MYTVRFVDYDNRLIKTERVAYGKDATAPSDPSRSGYTFIGWDREYTNITADITVTAQYTQNTTGNTDPVTPVENDTPGGGDDDVETYTTEEILEILKEEGIGTINIGNLEIPLAAGSMNGFVWALLNLILVIAGVLFGITSVIRTPMNNVKTNENYLYENPYEKIKTKTRIVWLIISIATAVIGIIVFMLTENIKFPVVLTDKWTIVNFILFLGGVVSVIFLKNRKHKVYEEDEEILSNV